jgi:hypothetical protein
MDLHGFYFVTMLPPRVSFNALWFSDGNWVPLAEKFFPARWSAARRGLGLQIDNASAHGLRMAQNFFAHNLMKRLLHPPYSFDLSPSDFYLFGKVKSALIEWGSRISLTFLKRPLRF